MVTTISGYPFRRVPLNNVTPFTYRDGTTFLEELSGIKNFINTDLVEQLNDSLGNTSESLNTALVEFNETIESNNASQNGRIDEGIETINGINDNIRNAVGPIAADEVSEKVGDFLKSPEIYTPFDGRYTQKGELYANVLDYGARKDKTFNSTTGFQAALNAVGAAGGGTVFVPNPGPGQEYRIGGRLLAYPNTTLLIEPGTIIRRLGGSFGVGNVPDKSINPLKDHNDPYSGFSNITIDGGIWEGYSPDSPLGNDGYGEGFNCFAFACGRNITLRNLEVRNIATNHAVDINAMNGMLIENCGFYGYRDTSAAQNRNYTEAIQYSPLVEDDPQGAYSAMAQYANGAPSLHLEIRKCIFGPSKELGSWPAAFGNHSAQNKSRGRLTGNVLVTNCEFNGCTFVALPLYTFDNVQILNNTFSGCRQGIKANNFSSGRFWNHALRVWQSAPNRQRCHNHLYRDNIFIDTINDDILVQGTGVSTVDNVSWDVIKNVKILHNTRTRTTGRTTAPFIRALLCDDITISDNTGGHSSVGISVEACRGVTLADNEITNTAGYGILVNSIGKPSTDTSFAYSCDVQIRYNKVTETGSHGIGAISVLRFGVIANEVMNFGRTGGSSGLILSSCDTGIVSNNIVACTSTFPEYDSYGIAGYNSLRLRTTFDNVIEGTKRKFTNLESGEGSVHGPVTYVE